MLSLASFIFDSIRNFIIGLNQIPSFCLYKLGMKYCKNVKQSRWKWAWNSTIVQNCWSIWKTKRMSSNWNPVTCFIELDLLPTYERFPYNICDGCSMLTGHAYSSGHLVPSHIGLAYVLLVETYPLPELVVIFSLRISFGTISILS